MVAGGPLPHVMAAKGVCFREALKPGFQDYAAQIVKNAQALSESLEKRKARVLTGGTDNHLVLIDLTERGYTGRQAEEAFRECNVTLNRNTIPFDENGAWYTSGLRAGTAALTTTGMKEAEMDEVAAVYATILDHIEAKPGSKAKYVWTNEGAVEEARAAVKRLMDRFPALPRARPRRAESAVHRLVTPAARILSRLRETHRLVVPHVTGSLRAQIAAELIIANKRPGARRAGPGRRRSPVPRPRVHARHERRGGAGPGSALPRRGREVAVRGVLAGHRRGDGADQHALPPREGAAIGARGGGDAARAGPKARPAGLLRRGRRLRDGR